ncbi:mechanosensitive channel MscK [Halomonas koreensis]|uniref:Mechanosensitive channel MscK n=1 Tax=Halomonas koreensis TaxID=245385 RepID=A0ABU1G539_9GAMM|nr:mechanosensitive channel MscK [Halomonas koreensis]MDR5868061.1 mechanosensitive channel MscK [Halomonas koreensis]
MHIVCLLWPWLAVQAAELPEREAVASRLEALRPAEGAAVEADTQRDIEALEAALTGLAALSEVEDRLRALEARTEAAPRELRETRRALERPASDDDILTEDIESLALAPLERRLAEANEALAAAQDRLAEVETRLLGTQTLPERAQQGITQATEAMEASRRALEELKAQGVEASAPRRLRHRVEQALGERRLALHQRELAANSRFRQLAQLRRDLLQRRVARLEAGVQVLQRAVERRRRERSEQTIAEAVRDEPEDVARHPLIREAQQANREMSLELLRATSRANDLARRDQEARRRLDRVRQLQRGLDEHIEAIRGSPLLSRILREQRQALPRVETQGDLQEEIADLRLKQFELDRQREPLQDPERLARRRLGAAGTGKSETGTSETGTSETGTSATGTSEIGAAEEVVGPLAQLYRARRALLDQLEPTYGELLTSAIELQLSQQRLVETSRELRTAIDEQLFWVANARPLGLAWLKRLPDHLRTEWREGEWRRALPGHWRRPRADALLAVPLLLLAGGLALWRRPLRRRLRGLHGEIGHLRQDSQGHTPLAILLEALLALPGPLCLLALGAGLALGGTGIAPGVGWALQHLALAWAVIAWARRLLTPGGVATRHFHWPADYGTRLRRWLLWLGTALAPVLLVGSLARDAAVDLTQRPVALALLLAGLVGMSLALSRLILAHTPFFGVKLFRLLLGLALALVPLVLGGLIVFGYAYTALSLMGRFVVTLYLLGLWILVEATVVRGLAVAARRLAYRRALARRRALAQESEGGEHGLEVVEEPPLDMQQVNQQSLRLSKLILMIAFLAGLYLVWADLLRVFGYLEQVMILGGEGEAGSDLVGASISVADLGVALLVVALTMVMARNLPGLLEVMVLSRLELKQGSAYAISSLLSYVIVGTGVIWALGTLGVSWSKLQWLVAALGVGLGFGLQEIFANFISGLIILFERPVRIGDTITLGPLTGTVNRIRIRATTVTDFDRKEIIIPNKTFVTDQLINWSLSDNITRVILTYNVAYGADHALVHRTLASVAEANARVLDDPEPQVLFMRYGPSGLEFELRIFVNSLGDRLLATDEINARVGERFAELGLDIAFNQLDVWLRRHDGSETRLARRGPGPAPDAPPPGAEGDPGTPGEGEAGR